MPTYCYRCTRCQREFDRFTRIEERNLPQSCGCGPGYRLTRIPALPARGRVRDGTERHPDQFTADALGIKMADLPPGLKEKGPGVI